MRPKKGNETSEGSREQVLQGAAEGTVVPEGSLQETWRVTFYKGVQ